jgi:hypothetical protein
VTLARWGAESEQTPWPAKEGKTVGKPYNQLDKRLYGWIAAQHIFFVATAPQRPGGHVNLSPKGHADTFAVLDERTVTYLA